jgi:hypothetical protein
MVLLMQTYTILNRLHMTRKICEVCIKILYVTQAVTSLNEKDQSV